ncbi:hypothetical protein CDD80_5642 [Ophiocordyceps camponoti-rufipedis]|uniref:Ubiquitin 3 binding protein But2 C-terminal domain-containing protein n=1 Tax=Ophiocordyceps camponoti-rufipedis TaxID=2004952 RepID=A0A2C5ZGS7_9HYPO|nr:hypothetical protein CDD80_5642 [Ophiocordyceps camponoti-rufipedis]
MALSLLLALTLLLPGALPHGCPSSSSPNPIADRFPDKVTGTLNGTTLIVPVDLAFARRVIPAEFGILEGLYRELVPEFPAGRYPMVVTTVHDHDVGVKALNVSMDDFSVCYFPLEFPFVDRLNNNHTPFRWAATMLLTTGSAAINGSQAYGIKVHPSTFHPPCNAYNLDSQGTTTLTAKSTSPPRSLSLSARPDYDYVPYPFALIRNITNQPTFALSSGPCDAFARVFDTPLTGGANRPVPVRADVRAELEPVQEGRSWFDVYGWRFSSAFVEPVLPVECKGLA